MLAYVCDGSMPWRENEQTPSSSGERWYTQREETSLHLAEQETVAQVRFPAEGQMMHMHDGYSKMRYQELPIMGIVLAFQQLVVR